MAALLTSASTRPNSLSASSTVARQSLSLPTSCRWNRAAAPIDAATASPFARVREQAQPQAHCVAPRDLSGLDWRVKTPADYAFARAVYDALYDADPGFSMQDVLDIIQGRQDLARWAA